MKRISLLLAFCLLAMSSNIRAQTTTQIRTFTAAGVGITTSQIGRGLYYHKTTWNVSGGTLSACQVKIQQSYDATNWTDLIAAETCTSNGSSTINTGLANYVRVNATTLTVATGTPTLTVFLGSYIDRSSVGYITGDGTAKRVPFWASASALSDDANFSWDATTGLAIGKPLKFDGGTFDTTLQAGTPTASITYTLPPDKGTAGQQLTDAAGDGVLSWASATTGAASIALSNLASVALNTALLPDAAAADDFGSATLPFKDLWFAGSSGTAATNNFRLTGTSTLGTRVITFPDASVTVNAAANISGTTLASNVVTSSLTTVGTISSGAWNATEIAATKGGTGLTGFAIGDLLYAATTTTLDKLAAVAVGQVLVSAGVGTAPAWSVTPTVQALTLSHTAPTLTFTDTTTSAKDLTFKVDANLASFYESAGAAGSLLDLDLANNRVGIGTSTPPTKHFISGTAGIGSYTDGSNYEYGKITQAAGTLTLSAETAGTGTDNINLIYTPAGTGLVYLNGPSTSPMPGSGIQNERFGNGSGLSNTTGHDNATFGFHGMEFNTEGIENASLGGYGMRSNTTGSYNSNLGFSGLYANTEGTHNSNVGTNGLVANTSGSRNSNVGYGGLQANTTANNNSNLGHGGLYANITGASNSNVGQNGLASNTVGGFNSNVGSYGLYLNVVGNNNSSLGFAALESVLGSGNIGLGYYSGAYATGSNEFFVNNQDRTNYAGDQTKSIIYGVMAALAADQHLTFNVADVTIPAGNLIIGTTKVAAGNVTFYNATSGSITLQPTTGALGASVITLPAATITVNAAGDISGTTLASNVVTSSLTAVGTLATGTWSADVIAMLKGGTAKAMTASLGAIAFSDADSLELSGVGTVGQELRSAGAATPVWKYRGESPTALSETADAVVMAAAADYGVFTLTPTNDDDGFTLTVTGCAAGRSLLLIVTNPGAVETITYGAGITADADSTTGAAALSTGNNDITELGFRCTGATAAYVNALYRGTEP